jgi:hypothetical protein
MKQQYSEEELLEILRNFYKEHGRVATMKDLMENKDLPSYSTYLRRFGALKKATKKAGILESSYGYTENELLEKLMGFYKK